MMTSGLSEPLRLGPLALALALAAGVVVLALGHAPCARARPSASHHVSFRFIANGV